MNNEEKAKEICCEDCLNKGWDKCKKTCTNYAITVLKLCKMAEWKDEQYRELVYVCKQLISELQTSRNYHLGITALDTPQEVEEKEIEDNTALIRCIDCTIQYSNEIINKFLKNNKYD